MSLIQARCRKLSGVRRLVALAVVASAGSSLVFAQAKWAGGACSTAPYVKLDPPDRLEQIFGARKRYRLVIGASVNLVERDRDLPFVEATARLVDRALQRSGYTESLGFLVGKTASRSNILTALRSMESLDPSALVAIYYVGHGSPSIAGDDLFLAVADERIGDDSGIAVRTLLATALKPFDPRFRKIPRVILVIESCFSGGATVFQAGFRSIFADRPTDFTRLAFLSSSSSTEESRPLPGDSVAAFGRFFAEALDNDWRCSDKTPDGALTVMEIATRVHERLAASRAMIGGPMQPDFLDRGHYSTLVYRPERVASLAGYRDAIQAFYEVDVRLTASGPTSASATITVGGDKVTECTSSCQVLTDSPELTVVAVSARFKTTEQHIENVCTSGPFARVCVAVPRTVQRIDTETVTLPLTAARGPIVTGFRGGLVEVQVR